jgi:hypothetical protein
VNAATRELGEEVGGYALVEPPDGPVDVSERAAWPDYLPSYWTKGRLNSLLATPGRALAWWMAMLPIGVALVATHLPGDDHGLRDWSLAAVGLLLVSQALRFGPRAWAASRR